MAGREGATLPPSASRLAEARRWSGWPESPALTGAAVLIIAGAAGAAGGARLVLGRLAAFVHASLASAVVADDTFSAVGAGARRLATLVFCLAGGGAVVSVLVRAAQTGRWFGGAARPETKPGLQTALARAASGPRLGNVGALLLCAFLAALVAGPWLLALSSTAELEFQQLLPTLARVALPVLAAVAGPGLLWGVLDRVWRWAVWRAELRTTRAEHEAEQRQTEGNPQIKRLARRAHGTLTPEEIDYILVIEDARGARVGLRLIGGVPTVVAAGSWNGPRVVRVRDDELAAGLAGMAPGAAIAEASYDRVAELMVRHGLVSGARPESAP